MKAKVKVKLRDVELNINGRNRSSPFVEYLFSSFIFLLHLTFLSQQTNRPKMKDVHIVILFLFKAFMVSESALKNTRAKAN